MQPEIEFNHNQDTVSDEEIILRAKLDPKAFRPLYEKYYKKIFLFVLRRVPEKQLSADITSQVFLKALLGLEKYQIRGLPFSSWLYRIAFKTHI